jgi:hypothetical protein
MTTKDTKDTTQQQGPKADARNPSGASEEQLKEGENVGKVRGPDIDTSYHKYEFTDAYTGEPVETKQVIHDVPVGVNDDGSLKTEKGDKVFQMQGEDSDKPKRGADTKQSEGANQGEAGEHTSRTRS